MADDRHIEIYNVFYKTNISVKKTTTDVVLKVGRKETERVARESGGLGAKPPFAPSGVQVQNPWEHRCRVMLSFVLQCGRYPRSA